MVAVEFITIMAAADRLAEAARVLPYLDTTGDFGRLARDTLVPEAVQRIDAHPDVPAEEVGDTDARHALTFMRDVLDDLTTDAQATPADSDVR